MNGDGNATRKDGGAGEPGAMVDTIVLTYDRARDHLEIGGKCVSVDLMLDILARATRHLEGQWRQARMLEAAAALQQAQREAAVVATLRKGN